MKKLALVLCAIWMFNGCNTKLKEDNTYLLARLDSLQLVEEENKYLSGLLIQIEQYMDSIDIQRNKIDLELEAGIPEEDYVLRMKSLNEYVQKAEWTINQLSRTNNTHNSQIKNLRKEISGKDEEIEKLQHNALLVQQEITQLKEQITLTNAKLRTTQNELENKEDELSYAESQFLYKLQASEAEFLYALGEGKEEVTMHMQFARKKKKQKLIDALDYYSNSNDLGYEPAMAKISYLKEKLKIN
jgi:chromosome segregation ATPase